MPGASAPLDADHEERAIYVTEGEIEIAGDTFEAPRLLIFRPGDRITVKATRPSRLMFLGGAALEGPRYLWWNFVSSRKERIEEAKEEWKTGRFAPIPGDEKEFIPLPENWRYRCFSPTSSSAAPATARAVYAPHCSVHGLSSLPHARSEPAQGRLSGLAQASHAGSTSQ